MKEIKEGERVYRVSINAVEVRCRRCGSIIGFQVPDKEVEKVEKVRFVIGEKVLEELSARNFRKIIECPYCGYKFKLKKKKQNGEA